MRNIYANYRTRNTLYFLLYLFNHQLELFLRVNIYVYKTYKYFEKYNLV